MTDESALPDMAQKPKIDSTVPHSARVWNYWLGGKDHYPADRAAGDQFWETFPEIVEIARASRAFLTRAVRFLAGEAGIRQFLDIGTGLPTVDNTHEVAQRIAPEARIVYVDNDPLVLAHARALLTSTPEGTTDYLYADLREPDTILDGAARFLDFTQPIALMLMGILGHISDAEDPHAIVSCLLDALPSGSYLSYYDGTSVTQNQAFYEAQRDYNEGDAVPYTLRSREEITRFFGGLEVVEPGIVSITQWRPEPDSAGIPAAVDALGGLGRKP